MRLHLLVLCTHPYVPLPHPQAQLYEDFAKSQAKQEVDETLMEESKGESQQTTHVFQVSAQSSVCLMPSVARGEGGGGRMRGGEVSKGNW